MEISETIREWLNGFDAIIDSAAVEPSAVKQDGFLRRVFELAFPPKDLPSKITLNSEGEAVSLEPIIKAHRPYYRAKTIQRERTDPKTGAVKVTSRLELSLKSSDHVILVLKENGIVRENSRIVTRSMVLAKTRKRRSDYSKNIELLLKVRNLQAAGLAQVEAFLRGAEKREDFERSRLLGADL
jgi:hypothetical protein